MNYAGLLSREITSVTTSDGRSINFTYACSGTAQHRVTSITAASRTYSYNYQAIANVPDKYFLTSVTRPGGTSWTYVYNGNLGSSAGSYIISSLTYPEGGALGYGYGYVSFDTQANPQNRATVVLSKAASPGGASWSFTYAAGAPGVLDVTTATTPSGTIVYKHVGPNFTASGTVWTIGLLMSKSLGSVQSETCDWDKQGISAESYSRPGVFNAKVDIGQTYAPVLKKRTINRNGATHATDFSNFDAYGNPLTVSETGPNGGNRVTTLTYNIDSTKWLIRQVKSESFSGSSIARTFDANGNLTSIMRNGVVTGFGYDGQGNVASATYPRGLVHTYSGYSRGIPTIENQPEAVAIARTVDAAGNVLSETNGDGFTTSYGYDGLNRITSITYPHGNAVSVTHTAASKVATRGLLVETTNYDGFARPSSITLGGIARVYLHDALGRMTFRSNPGVANPGTTYQYDILDRLIRTDNADGTFSTVSFGAGTRTVTDERFKMTTYSYRSYGDPAKTHLMDVVAPESSANISIQRNSVDLVSSATQAFVSRSYGYNANLNYHLTSSVDPETGTTTYGHDAAGNMTSKSVGGSPATVFGYDNQNRLIQVSPPLGTPAVANAYNRRGRLVASNSAAANRGLTYDENGNLTSESLTIDDGTGTVIYAYNANDQLQSITYPLFGLVVNYAPDVLGRPSQVSGFAPAVSYWPSGHISQINYSNGVATQYGQNSRLWTSAFSSQRNGMFFTNTSYGYDGKGNLTSVIDSIDTVYNRTLGYDNLDRLTTFIGFWGTANLSYDGRGNITNQSAPAIGYAVNYVYDASNRLASVSGNRVASLAYDLLGNVAASGVKSFGYNSVPNMTCADCGNTANRLDYAYDGMGRRVLSVKGGIKTYEMHDLNGNLLFEYTPALNRSVEHIYLGGKRIAQRASP